MLLVLAPRQICGWLGREHGGSIPLAVIERLSKRHQMFDLGRGRSVRLDVREFDHLGPLLSLLGDQLIEIRRRARKRGRAQLCGAGLNLRIGEGGIDLAVELVDDLGRCVLGRTDAKT
jgi:hypothetical protein